MPSFIFIGFLVSLVNYLKKEKSVNSELLLKNSFINLTSILKNTYLISENIEERIELKKFIFKETKINITTYSSESEIFNKSYSKLQINNSLMTYFKDGKKVKEIFNDLKPLMREKGKK